MRPVRLTMAGAAVALMLAAACRPVEDHGARWSKARGPAAVKPAEPSPATKGAKATEVARTAALYPVAPPPFSDGVFPCSECHGKTDVVNRTPHPVEFHEDIVLHHDEKNRWCLDCHDAQNRDKLHLADGRLIDFTESYRLCGQCHGPTLRNWKAGEHGKRTGSWNGAKQYLLCANCHSPHSPHFKPIKPKPAPMRQEAIK
ncbi:MAG TPA: hypothetical protein VGJ96_00620 [Gemmatimonadaceae bacterium]